MNFNDYDFPDPPVARGKALTKVCAYLGIRRRWFGLEPDWMFRRRVLAIMRGERRR